MFAEGEGAALFVDARSGNLLVCRGIDQFNSGAMCKGVDGVFLSHQLWRSLKRVHTDRVLRNLDRASFFRLILERLIAALVDRVFAATRLEPLILCARVNDTHFYI